MRGGEGRGPDSGIGGHGRPGGRPLFSAVKHAQASGGVKCGIVCPTRPSAPAPTPPRRRRSIGARGEPSEELASFRAWLPQADFVHPALARLGPRISRRDLLHKQESMRRPLPQSFGAQAFVRGKARSAAEFLQGLAGSWPAMNRVCRLRLSRQ
jgi:hypothetical protein